MTIEKKILNKYVKGEVRGEVGVIAISQAKKNMFWYHVHEDEDARGEV